MRFLLFIVRQNTKMTDSWRWPTVRAWPAPSLNFMICLFCLGCTYKFERILRISNSRPARPVAGRDEKRGARLNKTVGSKRKKF